MTSTPATMMRTSDRWRRLRSLSRGERRVGDGGEDRHARDAFDLPAASHLGIEADDREQQSQRHHRSHHERDRRHVKKTHAAGHCGELGGLLNTQRKPTALDVEIHRHARALASLEQILVDIAGRLVAPEQLGERRVHAHPLHFTLRGGGAGTTTAGTAAATPRRRRAAANPGGGRDLPLHLVEARTRGARHVVVEHRSGGASLLAIGAGLLGGRGDPPWPGPGRAWPASSRDIRRCSGSPSDSLRPRAAGRARGTALRPAGTPRLTARRPSCVASWAVSVASSARSAASCAGVTPPRSPPAGRGALSPRRRRRRRARVAHRRLCPGRCSRRADSGAPP